MFERDKSNQLITTSYKKYMAVYSQNDHKFQIKILKHACTVLSLETFPTS